MGKGEKEAKKKTKLKEFYIKNWYLFGIGWFLSLFVLPRLLYLVGVPKPIVKVIGVALAFPAFIYEEIFKGLDTGGVGLPVLILLFLIPCYILAKILESREKQEGE